jgi:hypothetical protein
LKVFGVNLGAMRGSEGEEGVPENIQNGPVFFSNDYYRANFDRLLSLPRRDALVAMARGMKR